MRQKALIISTYVLTGIALLSASPASAVPNCEAPFFCPSDETETVPEPGTIFGTMLIGGTMAWKKLKGSKKA